MCVCVSVLRGAVSFDGKERFMGRGLFVFAVAKEAIVGLKSHSFVTVFFMTFS